MSRTSAPSDPRRLLADGPRDFWYRRGFVRENWTPMRTTRGDVDATGTAVHDDQGTGVDIPAGQEVPLDVVHRVPAAYLTHGAHVPEDFPELRILSWSKIPDQARGQRSR